jgi:hypothetical protein
MRRLNNDICRQTRDNIKICSYCHVTESQITCPCFWTVITAPRIYIGEMEVYLHAFLISAVDAGEWSASRPGRFTPS